MYVDFSTVRKRLIRKMSHQLFFPQQEEVYGYIFASQGEVLPFQCLPQILEP